MMISSVQLLSRVWLFATPWITARQASLSITNSRSSLRLTSIESVMPSGHLILCRPKWNVPIRHHALYHIRHSSTVTFLGFPGDSSGEEPACQWKVLQWGFDPWVKKTPGGGHGNPLQYSCLENPTDRRAWPVTVHGVAKSRTQLNWLSTHA